MKSHLDKITHSHILQLQAAMRENRLVIFVGAGVSASAGMPVWKDLIRHLKKELPEDISDSNDMLKIAQLYREHRGEMEYKKEVKKLLKYGQTGINQIHTAIMDLNPCHIVTTNYDDLLEQSAIQNNKQYYVVSKDDDLPKNQGEKLLIKMHGDFREGNIVLTENDYMDYTSNFPLIRSFVLSLFSTKVVLFVGFSFDDVNLKDITHQITNTLGENMQKAYLLVDKPKDALLQSYYRRMGIQLLCLPCEKTKAILLEQGINKIEDFPDQRSAAINQSLLLINAYDPYNGDLVERAIDFFEENDNQIRFFGKYLDIIFPPTKRGLFYIRKDELMLPMSYENWFNEIAAKASLKRYFLGKYGAKIKMLRNKLVDNKITYVTTLNTQKKIKISGNEASTNHSYKNPTQAINFIYEFALDKIGSRLETLYESPLKYNINDLELPFLLFKLGRYYEAYIIYKQLAPEMWKRRKYVLYFICLYNIKVSFSRVCAELYNSKKDLLCKYRNEVETIDLKNILRDLPLQSDVKVILEELENGNMQIKDLQRASKLNYDINQMREIAKRGGWSISDKVVSLLDVFDQLFFFCNENYIINECNDSWYDSNKAIAEGIINSIMTPVNHEWQSKLDYLSPGFANLFVFMIKPKVLAEMLVQLTDNKHIPAETKFVDALGQMVQNLNKHLEKTHKLIKHDLVVEYLKNILLMLNVIESAPIIPNIYGLVINYWDYRNAEVLVKELIKLFKRQPPSAKEAVQIINCLLQSKPFPQIHGIEYHISKLSGIAKNNGEYLENIASIEQITKFKDPILESSFYWSLPEKYRKELINHLRVSVDSIYDLCFIEKYTQAHIITPELIKKLEFSLNNDKLRPKMKAQACKMLHEMEQDEKYLEIHSTLEEFKKVNNCYRFISDPLEYDKIDEIKGWWLYFVADEETLKKLLGNSTIREIAKNFCNENHENEFKERIWNLMT